MLEARGGAERRAREEAGARSEGAEEGARRAGSRRPRAAGGRWGSAGERAERAEAKCIVSGGGARAHWRRGEQPWSRGRSSRRSASASASAPWGCWSRPSSPTTGTRPTPGATRRAASAAVRAPEDPDAEETTYEAKLIGSPPGAPAAPGRPRARRSRVLALAAGARRAGRRVRPATLCHLLGPLEEVLLPGHRPGHRHPHPER